MGKKLHYLFLIFLLLGGFCFSALAQSPTTAVVAADPNVLQSAQKEIAHIRGIYKQVTEENRFTEMLSMESVKNLPIALSKTIGGQEYVIMIDKVEFRPNGTYLDASLLFILPTTGDTICFRGRNIGINSSGLNGDAKLYLVWDKEFEYSSDIKIKLVGSDYKTFAEWDCAGFKSFGIKGEVLFSEKMLVKDTEDGTAGKGQVRGYFETTMSDWGDFVAQITVEPFQLTSFKGLGFKVSQAILDLSEVSTPSNVTFPQGYTNNQMLDGNKKLWQGFYMKEFAVRFPQELKDNKDPKPRKELDGYNIIIDNMGLSGSFTFKNALPMGNGEMDGWAFSVDSIGVTFVTNQIKSGGLRGLIRLPLGKSKTTNQDLDLGYIADIYSGNRYHFNVSLKEELPFDLWKAKIVLFENSNVDIKVENGKFLPVATLHGKISVSAESVSLVELGFQGLRLATKAPYVKVQSFALSSEAASKAAEDAANDLAGKAAPTIQKASSSAESASQKMSNFPLTLRKIGYEDRGELVGIMLEIGINLSKDGGNSFSAEGGFTVLGKLQGGDGKPQSFKFERVEINKIAIDTDLGAIKLKGLLLIYREHAIYGTGFKGMIDATFIEKINVRVTAQFGTVNSNRYWYVDGQLTLPVGIPICTGVGIYGFGGGAYKGMSRDMAYTGKLPNPDVAMTKEDLSDEPGVTLSGVKYIPDVTIGLGVKAAVIFGTMPSSSVFNGEIGFEIAFNKTGGVDFVALTGQACLITNIAKRNSGDATIKADVEIMYSVTKHVFHASVEISVNVVGVLSGGGGMVIHAEPGDWYIYVGHPDKKIAVDILGIVKVQAYFMCGTEIPALPPLPRNITDILGPIDPAGKRDVASIAGGKGMCFGASVNMDTGEKVFVIFYGKFALGMGFDVMLKEYPASVVCENTGSRIGMNGWYASGQAYAYIQAAIGIKVNLKIIQGKYDILSLGAAAVMEARLPKPTWFRATVGGKFSILNGLVKGNCKFQLEIGEKCITTSAASLLADIEVIQAISPEGESDVSVFTTPQATFNLTLNQLFSVDDYEREITRFFRAKLDHIKIFDGSQQLSGNAAWNADGDVIAFTTLDILPQKKSIRVEVSVSFEEMLNQRWSPVLDNGKAYQEIKSTTFTTGLAPDHIVPSNVLYSYPMPNQFNFYSGEHPTGYVKLKQGQPNLFEIDANKWKQVLRYTAVGQAGNSTETEISYDKDGRIVTFGIPAQLGTETVFLYEMVNIPTQKTAGIDDNVTKVDKTTGNEEDGSVSITTKQLSGSREVLSEHVLYGLNFRTSRYGRFMDKVSSLSFSDGYSWQIVTGIDEIRSIIITPEQFDKYEILGDANIEPTVLCKAVESNPWLGSQIKPLIYTNYPVGGTATITWRDPIERLGLVPVKGIWISQSPMDRVLNQSEIATGVARSASGNSLLSYGLEYYTYKDFTNLSNECAAKFVNTPLYTAIYPNLSSGTYEVDFSYQLPGLNVITSYKRMQFRKP